MDTHTNQHKRQKPDESSRGTKRVKRDGSVRNGLADLPEEVLLLILDTILGALVRYRGLEIVMRHVAALHSLSLTNRKFNRLTTPYLCAFITNRNRRKLPQALDTLILNPKKAESTKYISWVLDVRRSSQALCRRSPKAETLYLQKLGKLGIPELAGDLRQCFHGNSPEYHLATALILAPSLEYLEAADVNYEQETVDDMTWRPTWLELLALKALSTPPGLAQHFQNLHHLQLSMSELSFEQIGPLLRLPALRIMHFRGGQHNGRIEAQSWNDEVQKRCSTVETLIFESCFVSSHIVAQILDVIQCLKVLKLEINDWISSAEDEDESGVQQHSWSELSRAISEHKESLERLYLVDGGTDPYGGLNGSGTRNLSADGQQLDCEYMDCLQDLPKLQYLDTGFRAFPVGYRPEKSMLDHMLLPSLKHLVLKAEENLIFPVDAFEISLQDLATDCRSRLPLLRDIVLWLPKGSRATCMEFSACLKDFSSQDIHLAILHYSDGNTGNEASVYGKGRNLGWRLHPSIADGSPEESSMPNRGSWGCQLVMKTDCSADSDGRGHIVFHGPCSAYHDPYGWSIIDNPQSTS